jgi:SAM-dependent methyltransferase
MAGEDWAGYYAWTSDREPRPALLAACELAGAGAGRVAIDLGCGSGTETLVLLSGGWSVQAIDSDPVGLELLSARIPAGSVGRIHAVCASFTDARLPPAHLIHAGYSLPFCPPEHFPGLWARIRRALLPGGVFTGQLFGPRDTWAGQPDMVFHDLPAVRELLSGLEIVDLHETERDGESFSGPKHWHLFEILARDPRTPTGSGAPGRFAAGAAGAPPA